MHSPSPTFHRHSVNDALNHQPQIAAEGSGVQTWITRASNFVVATSLCQADSSIETEALADESMVLFPDVGALLVVEGHSFDILPDSVVILPPGAARITARGVGTVVRCCSSRATALMALAANGVDFAQARREVTAPSPWPLPFEGYRVRIYHLPSLTRDGEKMRIIRCTNLMVNVFAETFEARDTTALSPHSHADFEQATVCVRGRYVHHLRTPWGPDISKWREDAHVEVGSPSVTVIPAGIVHTSRNVNEGGSMLIDVFSPPRLDFALHPSWCLNSDDYPLPQPTSSAP